MDALEAFSQIVGFWPNSFKPRDTWKPVAMEELASWSSEERSAAVRSLQSVMGRNKTVDIETLRKARNRGAVTRGNASGNTGSNTESAFMDRLGLLDTLKSQHISDRIMISRLIKSVMRTPGWEAALEEQAGDPEHFKPWERIENLLRAAEKAMIETSPGRGRKICYPEEADGWTAPSQPVRVHLPRPRVRGDVAADRAGLARISQIAAKFGGFNPANTGSMAAIYHSPEYQAYLKDYTDRTGLEPA
jgi:hypothetical protein